MSYRDRQEAFDQLPEALQQDVTLTLLVAQALSTTTTASHHEEAAAALVAAYRARQ